MSIAWAVSVNEVMDVVAAGPVGPGMNSNLLIIWTPETEDTECPDFGWGYLPSRRIHSLL
ncbi:hypothetical protein CERSUDRAFT_115385 [Gelatoporia subvermispora B]|uniref:Uncharacterized protein n=1 Tax=Ceriporiopsis subvermispora (strain B) TaxID=914234 RepID=M2QWA1_CERS8|nr:hypothetical protein CERSUDRAFT_115385 [Gelatoporia subvermispora B]